MSIRHLKNAISREGGKIISKSTSENKFFPPSRLSGYYLSIIFETAYSKIFNHAKKIRLRLVTALVFCFLWLSCTHDSKPREIVIIWEEGKAKGVSIPHEFIASVPRDSIQKLVYVRLTNNEAAPPILGEYLIAGDSVLFRPAIPFTRGLSYNVMMTDQLLGKISIPPPDSANAPEVVAIYPTRDTVPENLLKIYIQFSKPMQEGEILHHIVLVRNDRDTVSSVFLDLEPELWSKDRTMVTLWLDPGRIKRDLQPNKTMGPPLKKGERYQLLIRNDWRDAEGASLAKPFQKNFVVGKRDSLSPDPSHWRIDVPTAESHETLQINFHESLDYALLTNTIRVMDTIGEVWPGEFIMKKGETGLYFKPVAPWRMGQYIIEIKSILEDNAGNNLNRLFDTDLTRKKAANPKEVFRKSFYVK